MARPAWMPKPVRQHFHFPDGRVHNWRGEPAGFAVLRMPWGEWELEMVFDAGHGMAALQAVRENERLAGCRSRRVDVHRGWCEPGKFPPA